MTLVHADEPEDTLEKYEELWKKIKNIVRATGNGSDNYDGKNLKIKLNSDDDLLLKKTLELYNTIIVIGSVFHKSNKYYPQTFDKSLHN